jgi:hypothetical protein
MRTYINPGAWFYGEDEELPENAYKPAKKKEWDWRNSLGMKKLLEMTAGDVHAFAVSHNLPYFPVWSMREQRNPPSFSKILMMKPFIDPASWFFYNE